MSIVESRFNSLQVSLPTSLGSRASEESFRLPDHLSRMTPSALTDMMALCAGQRAYILGQMALIEVDMLFMLKRMNRQKAVLISRSPNLAKWKIEEEVIPSDSAYAKLEDKYDEDHGVYKLLDAAQQGVYDKHQVLSRELTRRGQEMQVTR